MKCTHCKTINTPRFRLDILIIGTHASPFVILLPYPLYIECADEVVRENACFCCLVVESVVGVYCGGGGGGKSFVLSYLTRHAILR